jgi:glucose-6-phosphate-specific signal transduction histidine kinase
MSSEALFKLPFDAVMQILEQKWAELPPQVQYRLVNRDLITHLLEELSVKIWDRDATSHVNMAMHYLKLVGVDEMTAYDICHNVFNAIFSTVISFFPRMTFQELATGRYILDEDNTTLLVYLKQPEYA